MNIFSAGQFGVKSSTNFQKAGNPASNLDTTFSGRCYPWQNFQEGGLSSAIWSDYSKYFSIFYFQVDIIESKNLIILFSITHVSPEQTVGVFFPF